MNEKMECYCAMWGLSYVSSSFHLFQESQALLVTLVSWALAWEGRRDQLVNASV